MKRIKLSDKRLILIILSAVGIMLMIFLGNTAEPVKSSSDSALVLEEKIGALLKKAYNARDVSVILTYDTIGEKITSADTEKVKSMFGSGGNEPFVVSEKLPYVRGVLISVENLSEGKATEIQQAVATLLGISSSKVNVIYSEYGG